MPRIDKYQESIQIRFIVHLIILNRAPIIVQIPLPLHFRIYDICKFCFIIQ